MWALGAAIVNMLTDINVAGSNGVMARGTKGQLHPPGKNSLSANFLEKRYTICS